MSEERGLLRAISWHESFPWLVLFRAALIGFYLRVLFIAYLAVCVLAFGDWIAGHLFEATPAEEAGPFAIKTYSDLLDIFMSSLGRPALHLPRLFGAHTVLGFVGGLFSVLWWVATFSLFGGAISRIAAMEFSVNDRCGMKAAMQHSAKKFTAYFLSPLFPLFGVTLLMLVLVVFGLLNWLATWIAVLTGLVGFLAVLAALGIGMLMVPLVAGWPLMWGAISAECSDHFDALQRTYSYVTQRPFHYVWYLIIACLAGVAGHLAMGLFVGISMSSLATGLTWGQGTEQTEAIMQCTVAGSIWRFWFEAIQFLVPAYDFGYFFSVFSGIYLLLRHDVDQAEMDEIVLDENQPRFAMPALNKDLDGKSDSEGNSKGPED
ncbi:hypothetical protein GC197_01145 [bacterium]|nr:hypothetical protein [bacterium]